MTSTLPKTETSLKPIYLISGLGADERLFQRLKWEGYEPIHIHWEKPQRDEPIDAYARRLAQQITTECPILVGLSFGGIMAIEIAKQMEVESVIVISSAKTSLEIPRYFRLFRWFPIYRWFPFKQVLWACYWFLYWFFGVNQPEERQMLKAVLMDTDMDFLRWALHRVVVWNNSVVPERLYHVHGMGDRIFPLRWVKPDRNIERGGHLMVWNQAEELSALLADILKKCKEPEAPTRLVVEDVTPLVVTE